MFAHGEAELRTTAQNVADGLVNETSIRKYKRAQYEARKRAARSKPAAPASSPSSRTAGGDTAARTHHPMPAAVPAFFSAAVPSFAGDCSAPSAASILCPNGVRDVDACSADESASVYGAGEDEGALSDSGNTSHRRPRSAPAASGFPFRGTSAAAVVGGSRFRHDPYSVECTLRLAPVRLAASGVRGVQKPLPAALVSLDRSSSDASSHF
jgi:hypothetical protein